MKDIIDGFSILFILTVLYGLLIFIKDRDGSFFDNQSSLNELIDVVNSLQKKEEK